jgi:potassium-transporting ATPase KdpC subunit
MRSIVSSIRVFTVFAILLGFGYPALITGISQAFMPYKANGSLIVKHNQVIGSELIGQDFSSPRYFHGRFSAVGYDASNSGAADFGPSSKIFLDTTRERIKKVMAEDKLKETEELPADMVLTSASGLDPSISLHNAGLQLARVAKARNIPTAKIVELIRKNTDTDFIGIWGQKGVNVLKLNIALDELK